MLRKGYGGLYKAPKIGGKKKHVCLTRINIHNMGEASVKVRIGASCAEGTNSSLSQTMFSLSS